MTNCVATLCDNGSAILMVADKMIGMGYVESELEITKMRQLHPDWWMLFAGDDLSSVFDIVDYAKADLNQGEPVPVSQVSSSVEQAVRRKRKEDAEALYLSPIDWTMRDFKRDGSTQLPNFSELQSKIDSYTLPIQLLVAGLMEERATSILNRDTGKKGVLPIGTTFRVLNLWEAELLLQL